MLSNYPIPAMRQNLAALSSGLCFAGIGALFLGPQALTHLGMPVPQVFDDIADKRTILALGIWFISGTITQNLQSTGAFEMFYDGRPIFSKMAKGRMPRLDEVVDGINAAVESRRT